MRKKRKLSSFDVAIPVPGDDFVAGLQKQSNGRFKNVRFAMPKFRVYDIQINQTMNTAPTEVVLDDSLLGSGGVWSYQAPGIYQYTRVGAFAGTRVLFSTNNGSSITIRTFGCYKIDDDNIAVIVRNNTGYADDLLVNASLQMRVYP